MQFALKHSKVNLILASVLMLVFSFLATPSQAIQPASTTADTGLGSVYFAPMSSKLSNNAKRDIDTILAANPGVAKFNVVGYSQWAPWGSEKSYERMSMLRAASVTSYMKSRGVTVEILNESGGLPETGGKTSKARRVNVYAVLVGSSSTASGSTESTSGSRGTSGGSSGGSSSSCPEIVTLTNAAQKEWTLADNCGNFRVAAWPDFRFSLDLGTSVQIVALNDLDKLVVPSGIVLRGDAYSLGRLFSEASGNLIIGNIKISDTHLTDELAAINVATSGAMDIFNKNAPLEGSSTLLIKGLQGVDGYTGTVKITDANVPVADIDFLLGATTGVVTTAALQGGTYTKFASRDQIDLTGKFNISVAGNVLRYANTSGGALIEITATGGWTYVDIDLGGPDQIYRLSD